MSDSDMHQPPRNITYPAYDQPILQWYAGYYDCVFVAFHPFFRLATPNVSEYPDDHVIKQSASRVRWCEMQARSGIPDAKLLNQALLTAIGALNERYTRPDLYQQLMTACERDDIFMPGEGLFEPTMDRDIVRAFQLAGYEYATFGDEFAEDAVVKPLAPFATNSTTIRDVWLTDNIMTRNLYSPDKRLLFTVDWDSFYTLICSAEATVRAIVDECAFEGFYCMRTTYHHWWLADADP